MARIKAPIYGFYAGDDARIGATVPGTVEAMKAAGKPYEPVTYDGAGHGFMRAGEAPDANDAKWYTLLAVPVSTQTLSSVSTVMPREKPLRTPTPMVFVVPPMYDAADPSGFSTTMSLPLLLAM